MNEINKNNLTGLNFLFLWLGAAISIAEILTGGLFAPLGFKDGALAVLSGHVIGCTLLVLGGIIGTRERVPAIMSTRISFGVYGSYLFSLLNVLQLIGWTAVMVISGARSVNEISKILWSFDNMTVWCLVIGALVLLWIVYGKDGWKKLNMAAVGLLLLLTLVLSYMIFGSGALLAKEVAGDMTFGSAVELSVVMPLSWLPLIADYTRFAKTTKAGVWGSWLGYFIGSCWMYLIGLGAAIVTGNADPAGMMLAANLGLSALGIVVLATVTTTFMDAYSAGVTFLNLFPKLNERNVALAMTVIGMLLALVMDMEQYEDFLYAIGSVFAPLYAILLTDYFLLGNKRLNDRLLVNSGAVAVWVLGVAVYYQFVKLDLAIGATLPVIMITGLCYLVVQRWTKQLYFYKKPATPAVKL